MKRRHLTTTAALIPLLIQMSVAAVSAEVLTYTPVTGQTTAEMRGVVPFKKMGSTQLPQGEISFDEGALAVRILPEWTFDKVPVFQGPIIQSQTTASSDGKEAIISGIAYFRSGYWIDKLQAGHNSESVTIDSGTFHGNVTGFGVNTINFLTDTGNALTIPWAELQEFHSPRAFAFAVPATTFGTIDADKAWQVNAKAISLTATGTTPLLANALLKTDPLLRTDGDWSTKKLVMLGTALSIIELAQFTPDLVVALNRNHLYRVAKLRELQSQGIFPGTPFLSPPQQ